jgi:hypothetical protein
MSDVVPGKRAAQLGRHCLSKFGVVPALSLGLDPYSKVDVWGRMFMIRLRNIEAGGYGSRLEDRDDSESVEAFIRHTGFC